MMTLPELKAKASAHIAKSEFEQVFELLFSRMDPRCAPFQDLIQHSARHKRTLNDELNGVLSRENANLEYNQITRALQHLVSQLQEKDLGSGGSGEDPLARFARELPIDIPLTPLYLVNCDRRDPVRFFWSVFNDSIEQRRRFQFYFLPCCPSQQPEGFAERVVNELLEKELDSEYGAMDFRRRPSGEERLLIEPLPLGRDLEGSKKKFKKYFAERFGLANSELAFEEYLRTGLPALPWQYVVTAFKIIDDDWEDTLLRPYLEWLMSTFSATGPDIPNFLFFFIVTMKHAHREGRSNASAQEAMAGIKALVAARGKEREEGTAPAAQDAALIEPLPPVAASDLETWMDRLGDDIREDQKQRVIEMLVSRLRGDEASWYADRKEFNMERIEDFQEKVYHAHKHK
jgi:hypothetical protein